MLKGSADPVSAGLIQGSDAHGRGGMGAGSAGPDEPSDKPKNDETAPWRGFVRSG
jgi:hypothetical protein